MSSQENAATLSSLRIGVREYLRYREGKWLSHVRRIATIRHGKEQANLMIRSLLYMR